MDRLILREDTAPTLAGRTLTLRLCTYDRVYRLANGRRERIRRGALREPLSRPRGALRFRHIGERRGDDDSLDNLYGVLTALREEGDSVVGDFDVFEGAREDKLLRLVQAGAVTGASWAAVYSGSRPARDAHGPLVDITRISHLDGASITPTPAFDDAGVMAIREVDQLTATRHAAAIAAERAYWATLQLPSR